MKVIVTHAPAPFDLHVFAVDLKVRMDVDASVVSIMATHNDPPAVADDVEPLRHCLRRAACLDDDVGAATTSDAADRFDAVADGHVQTERSRRSHLAGKVETQPRRANANHVARP